MPKFLSPEEKQRRADWVGVCAVCSGKFPWAKNGDKAKYCSRVCAGKANGSIKTDFGKLRNYTCRHCNNQFSSYYKKRDFCSRKCSTDAWTQSMPKGIRCRLDNNHKEVVDALIAAGAKVMDASAVGRGFPDIVVLYKDRIMLMEIKNPNTAYGRAGLNKLQQKFHKRFESWPISMVDGVEAALRHLKVLDANHE